MNSRVPFDPRHYVATETTISVAVNTVVLLAPHFLSPGGQAPIAGGDGLALSAAPPLFMAGFMSALVPSLLTRARLRKGRTPSSRAVPSIAATLSLALAIGALGLVLAGVVLPALAGPAWRAVLQEANGGLLGALATPSALWLLFGPGWTAYRAAGMRPTVLPRQ